LGVGLLLAAWGLDHGIGTDGQQTPIAVPVRRRTDGQQTTNWYGERELTEREISTAIDTANGNDELRSSLSVLRGCLARELVNGRRRRAVWRGIDWPRGKECRETKFPRKKDDGLGILHNGWKITRF